MHPKSAVSASTSLLAALALALPAHAQSRPPVTDPGGTPAPPPVTPAPAGAPGEQDDGQAEAGYAIVVTGIRQSLRSAQNLKRNAVQIVDAIVAQDIGKLPDIAVSDTAARIPGIQVDRSAGEASRVLVRGLPDFTTTYNGREIFTAETRSVALQDFPSSFISALEVYKASTAELIEPGLAGLVNVRTRRPFDFDGLEIAGSAWALYTRGADKVTPNGNLLVSDRWQTGIGEIGALINLSFTDLKYRDSERSNTDYVADPVIGGQRVRFPDIQRIFYRAGERQRPAASAALQWRPAPGLEFYAEGLWQGFRNRIYDRQLAVPLYAGAAGTTQYGDLVLVPGTNLLRSGTVTGAGRAPDGFQGGTYNRTNTYQFALGGSFERDGLRITADVARTDTRFTGSTASVDFLLAGTPPVQFNNDIDGHDGGPSFTLVGFDPAARANYLYRGFYEEAQTASGEDWQARIDVSYETGVPVLSKVAAGVRYVDRRAERAFGNRYWGFEGARIGIDAVPLDYQRFAGGFRGQEVPPLTSWIAPTYASIRDRLVEMRRFNIALGAPAFGTPGEGAPPADPLQSYDAREKTLAGYFQADYAVGDEGAAVRLDGAFGLRIVRTQERLNGTSQVAGVVTPVAATQEYVDWLPNASARVRVGDHVALRLSATQTRTRPTFAQLNPSASLGAPPTGCGGAGDPYACARRGSGGNPTLEPLRSNNYDASLEFYYGRAGLASVALFRRDLSGFIQTRELRYIDPALGPLVVSGPVNSSRGRIDGVEAQLSTFFDFAGLPQWLHAFGVQANLTFLDARTDMPASNQGTATVRERMLDVSRWAYNVAGIYEDKRVSVRLSYNWRSSAPVTRDPRDGDLYREVQDPISRLDLSTSLNLTDKVALFFDWTNMLARPYTSTLISNRGGAGEARFPRFVRYEETTFSLGTRFRF